MGFIISRSQIELVLCQQIMEMQNDELIAKFVKCANKVVPVENGEDQWFCENPLDDFIDCRASLSEWLAFLSKVE